MSSAIVISKGNVWSIGTRGFYSIIEAVVANIRPKNHALADAMMECVSEGFDRCYLGDLSVQDYQEVLASVHKELEGETANSKLADAVPWKLTALKTLYEQMIDDARSFR